MSVICSTNSGGQLRNASYLLVRDARTFDPRNPMDSARVMALRALHIATRDIAGALKQYWWLIADPDTLFDDPLSNTIDNCIYPDGINTPLAATNNCYVKVVSSPGGRRRSTIGQAIEPMGSEGTDALIYEQVTNAM